MSSIRTRGHRVHVRAPGKINLSLLVGDVQPDGYHDVASIYQAVSLYENLWASLAVDDEIIVTGDLDVSGVPRDGSNLAARAARLVAERLGYDGGIRLEIHKGVPVAGGMGGGSADAAAALVAVNTLLGEHLGTELSSAELQELGARLGADVPFAVLGGTAVGTGRGDQLAPALARGRFDWVLVTRSDGLSTPAVYAELDRLRGAADIRPQRSAPAADAGVLQALRAGDVDGLARTVHNDLQRPACMLQPALDGVLEAGIGAGARAAFVSGSGPTLAFLAADAADAERLGAQLEAQGHRIHLAHGPVPGTRIVPTSS